MRVLVGDIGGTNARVGLVETNARLRLIEERTFRSSGASGLAPLVEEFLSGAAERPTRACFAVAGPVVDGEVRATNIPWKVSAAMLSEALHIPLVRLINDFEAVGHGVLQLAPGDLATLQPGDPDPLGPVALLGAGTGLGAGYLTRDGGAYRVHASEGGHATFAPETARERAVAAFLARRFEHVSIERIVSGAGLAAIYEALSGTLADPETVSARGLSGSDAAAVEALDIFAAAYGAAAGNLAVTLLATGGVYLAGGIAPLLIDKLKDGAFLEAFRRKGRLEPVLARIPVHVIMSPAVGLLGAAAVAAGA